MAARELGSPTRARWSLATRLLNWLADVDATVQVRRNSAGTYIGRPHGLQERAGPPGTQRQSLPEFGQAAPIKSAKAIRRPSRLGNRSIGGQQRQTESIARSKRIGETGGTEGVSSSYLFFPRILCYLFLSVASILHFLPSFFATGT